MALTMFCAASDVESLCHLLDVFPQKGYNIEDPIICNEMVNIFSKKI